MGAHLSQMHRDDCILSQLKRKLDEDPTGFPCRTLHLKPPQTFNILPACPYLFPFVSLGAAAARLSDSRRVRR